MPRGSVSARRSARPSTAGSASSEDSIATTVEIVERATCTLPGLRTADALQIWRALGLFVQDQLAQRQPVRVDQFGVFGLNESTEPVFLAEPSFLQTNRLRERERKGQVLSSRLPPVARVNPQQIGTQYLSKCRKEVVAAVIASVVALVGKWAKQGHRRGIRLGFLPAGEWQCDADGVVSFHFLAEFRKHLRLGTTGVSAAQVAASASRKGRAGGDGKLTKAGNRSPRVGSSLVSSRGSTSSVRAAHTRGSRLATRCETGSQNRESMRDVELATTRSLSSDAMSVKPLLDSASSQSSGERGAGVREKPARQSSDTVPARTNSSGQKTAASTRQAWAETRDGARADDVAARVRSKLVLRCGFNGLNTLERVLQAMTRARGFLGRRELKFGLRDLGVEVSTCELDELVDAVANGGDRDRLDLDAVVSTVRGSTALSECRRALIERAFRLMDAARRGVVTLDDIGDNYDVSALPKVRAGKQSPAQALAAFIREWEPDVGDGDKQIGTRGNNGGISLGNFVRYYHNVSACLADDSEFERMMRQLWHVSLVEDDDSRLEEGDGNNERDSNASALRQHQIQALNEASESDAREVEEAWKYLETLLLPTKRSRGTIKMPTMDEMCHRIGANRVLGDGNEVINTRAFAHALMQLDKHLETRKSKYLADLAASVRSNQGEQDGTIYLAELYKSLSNGNARRNQRDPTNSGVSGGVSSQVIERVRQRLLRRVALSSLPSDNNREDDGGSSGEINPSSVSFHGLARSLRLMDTNGDRRLSKDELKTGLCKFGVDVNFHEVDCLFAFFDTDQSGCISCEEFISGMRGDMNARRLALVHRAFDLLDTDGDGQVTLMELQAAYDCSKHPEVISGKMSAEDAIRVFASQWETNEPDGIITRDEFETYYKNLSASIDLDDYFELMMRNAWHMSGGEGQCANSTNRRMLLTNADGSERVVELRNDLGIKATDFARMRANLQAQGLLSKSGAQGETPSEIQLYDSIRGRDKKGVDWQALHTTNVSVQARQKRRVVPDRRFYRRSQFVQPASGSRSFLAMAETDFDGAHHVLESQRTLRVRAAELIQARFRGFRARKLVALVRRKMAAERQRRDAVAKEEAAASKRRILRAATRTVHGF